MDYTSSPKKSLGQHWLNDEYSLDAIVDAAEVNSEDTVLEIGPGLGSLTKKLAARAQKVVAVELDVYLANKVRELKLSNVTVLSEDILSFDLTTLPKNYKVVANIPYYLTSNLLRVLCESPNPFSRAALLVQKEVAERVEAKPGAMSLLSVSVQYYADVTLDVVVPAMLFTPPPKIDSQILVLQHRQKPLFPDVDEKAFFRLVKAGYSQRRKTLANSLSAGFQIDRAQAVDFLNQVAIDPGDRPQTLSIDAWYRLYKVITPLLSQ